MDRRKFIKIIGAAGLASMLPLKYDLRKGLNGLELRKAWGFQNSDSLQKFIQPLPGLGPGGIQVLNRNVDPVFNIANGFAQDSDYYQIVASQFVEQLHPQLPKPTKIWGYRDATQSANLQTHLGGILIAKRGTPVRLRVQNTLPQTHILPVDHSIPGAEADQAPNRMAIHQHGGYVPWNFDGGPFDWWTPNGTHGASFTNGPVGNLNTFYQSHYPAQALQPGYADYIYPNDQSYRLTWYHDHALGITRLNAYAGLASGYLITDSVETGLVNSGMLPPDNLRIPLIFQDKIFIPQNGTPDQGQVGQPGDFWYPSIYDGPPPPSGFLPLPIPSAVPEFFGDTMLVNGKVYPFVEVEQRQYRFLTLNACNARFMRIKLVFEDNLHPGEPKGGYTNPQVGPQFVQISTEGGFLPMPVTLTGQTQGNTLLLAPAERAEFIIDFSALPVGTKLLLYNDAPAPFPSGDDANDYYPGNPATPTSTAGKGPNTRTIMEFRVKARVGRADRYQPLVLPPLDPHSLLPVPNGTTVRDLTLNEGLDAYGRLIQLIGTNVANSNPNFGYGYPYLDNITETIPHGTTEVWRIANLTGDTHPMHIHLQNAQIVSRRPFDAANYNGTIVYTGPARSPDPNERGWKETMRMNPGEVIEIIAKWDLGTLPAGFPALEASPRTGGNEYVWHCHILEHEEHDMMHALVIT